MNQVFETNVKQKIKNKISKTSKVEIIKEEELSKQKQIIKVTSIGIVGLSALKLAPVQASVVEATIIKGVTTFLKTRSISFIGILGIPNYILIALLLFSVGVSYFTFKDVAKNKGRKVR